MLFVTTESQRFGESKFVGLEQSRISPDEPLLQLGHGARSRDHVVALTGIARQPVVRADARVLGRDAHAEPPFDMGLSGILITSMVPGRTEFSIARTVTSISSYSSGNWCFSIANAISRAAKRITS